MELAYWKKQDSPLYADLAWNIPEQKVGTVSIVGGNSQNFSNIIKATEYINQKFPIKTTNVVLPDALRSKLPPLPNLFFTESTESGSFKKSPLLNDYIANTDFSLILGDLSKNSATAIGVSEAIKSAEKTPILITRDTVDLVATEANSFIERENLFILASMAQLQKLFRALYYPKMLLLSMPLVPVLETLHKFTLSYPATIITFHQNQIIIANSGKIITTPIEDTNYTPLGLWSGELACKIAGLNLYNPNKPLEATAVAILQK